MSVLTGPKVAAIILLFATASVLDVTPSSAAAQPAGCYGHHCGSRLCFGERTTVSTGPGPQVILGSPGRDVINSGSGNDVVLGRGGNDLICTGPGSDVIIAGRGRDRVFAGSGQDVCVGGGRQERHFLYHGCNR